MKYKDFGDHQLHCVQKWDRFVRGVIETHSFEDSGDKEERGLESDKRETPIHETNRQNLNDILSYGYEVDYDRLPYPENKPIPTGNTDQPVYNDGQ